VSFTVPPIKARTHPVQVVAHRGASAAAPEHTLAAYQRAVDEGADALECDVRLTADGHLVCVHDRRVDRTSDGHGIVSTLELAQLDELDFGAWHDGVDAYADPELADRRRLVTLEGLLELVAEAGRPIELAVETKHPTRYGGLVERRLVEMLDRFGWAHPRLGGATPVRVMSFSWLSLRRMRAMAPSLATVYLMERVPLRFRDGMLPAGVGIAGPSIDIIRAHPGYVSRLKAHGHQVHVWTVDADADVTLCLELGVDAVITNRPADVIRRLTP
jgi:glycerophosphoryl diester phosphodiesterase